jgi:hypothetical protein
MLEAFDFEQEGSPAGRKLILDERDCDLSPETQAIYDELGSDAFRDLGD